MVKQSQTEKIFEHCHEGKWTCQTWFWANFIRSPHVRRRELVNQLNRADTKYRWHWESKDCNCPRPHDQVFRHRLIKTKI
ncbi:MAG: hypothetical protein ACD_51C00321G0001 [uncultured bacterium]|nr:MAG: hypothetical protein ACD_51C00321G0001 [uncultured bacterium]